MSEQGQYVRMYGAVSNKAKLRAEEAKRCIGNISGAQNHFMFYNSLIPALKHLALAVQHQDILPEEVADYGENAVNLVRALREIK